MQSLFIEYVYLVLIILALVLVTLVLQGLTLPWVIRKVNLKDNDQVIPQQKQEIIIQKKMALYSLQYLEDKYSEDWPHNEHLSNLHERLKIDKQYLTLALEKSDNVIESTRESFHRIYLEILEQKRKLLKEMNRRAEFDEDLIRKYLTLIDLEEFKIRQKQPTEA